MTAPGADLPSLSIRAWLRWDFIAAAMAELPTDTILEFGCGQGAMGARLAGYGDYLGYEPDEASAAVAARRIAPLGGTVVTSRDGVPAGREFDLVCAFEVLEHIEDDAGALAEWVTNVKSGGHLVFSVPAWPDRFGPMDEHAGHFRRYTPDSMTALLAGAGLTVNRLSIYGWPLGFALEAVRNPIDKKKLQRAKTQGASVEDLTAASGRTFQPPNPTMGKAIALATKPFRLLQRTRPGSGIGLLVVADKP